MVLVSMTLLLCGCLRTLLPPPTLPLGLDELNRHNSRQIVLNTEIQTSGLAEIGVGYQYLFIVVPFGRVEIQDPIEHINQLALRNLALRNWQVVPISHQANSALRAHSSYSLSLAVASLNLNAYDFLFFRRIVCSIQLKGTLLNRKSGEVRSATVEGKSARLRSFAYKEQLDIELHNASEEAMAQLVEQLGL